MQTVDREILTALSWATEPMTSTELVPHCHSALDRTSVSRGVHRMRTAGLIEAADERQSHDGRGARPIKAYRITDAGQDALDQATETAYAPPDAQLPRESDLPVLDEDPIIAELQELCQRPVIEHAEAHAERLRTLAERLRLIDPRTTWTRAWLRDLADLLDPDDAP